MAESYFPILIMSEYVLYYVRGSLCLFVHVLAVYRVWFVLTEFIVVVVTD